MCRKEEAVGKVVAYVNRVGNLSTIEGIGCVGEQLRE